MNNDDHVNNDHLEDNIEKLLSNVQPKLTMPYAAKARVLSTLTGRDAERISTTRLIIRKGRMMITSKRTPWATAAAAAVILMLVGFWPSGSQGAVVWADVVEQLNEVRTLIGFSTSEEISESGTRVIFRGRLYYKDPAMSRVESCSTSKARSLEQAGTSQPADVVDSVVIIVRGQDQSTETRLLPQQKVAQRTTTSFFGNMLDLRTGSTFNLAADGWVSLRRITSDETREIGEREINGVQTVGFEAPIRELFDSPLSQPPEGVVRVWAGRETAVPVEVEGEFQGRHGLVYKTTIEDIEWNVPLSDDLFGVSDLEGWEIRDTKVDVSEFSKIFLKNGVTLRIGSKDGPAVVSERGIDAIHSGESVEELGLEAQPRVTIRVALAPEVQEKVRAFTAEHLGERMVLDFNGEFQSEIRIGGVIEQTMQLDISPLGKTLKQFEDEYLTSSRPVDPD